MILTTAVTAGTAILDQTGNFDLENAICTQILDCCFELHKQYGAGLLESAYEKLVAYELQKKNLKVEAQKIVPLNHDGMVIDAGYRIDLLVDDKVIVELKCVEKLLPIHEAQLITYLKLSHKRLGLLINFNEKLLKNGIRRRVL